MAKLSEDQVIEAAARWRRKAEAGWAHTGANDIARIVLATVIDTATNIEHEIRALVAKAEG